MTQSKPVTKKDVAQELAIHSVAVGIYQKLFSPEKDDRYKPRQGTIIYTMWVHKKLTLKHQQAWCHFVEDLNSAEGRSGPIVSSYRESSGGSGGSNVLRIPTATTNASYRRLERLFEQLTREEKILLRDLIFEEVQAKGQLKQELIGFVCNGFKSEDQARASGATRITCLLERLGAFYGV